MTDFISRSDLHDIAEDLSRNSANDNKVYFVASEVLDYGNPVAPACILNPDALNLHQSMAVVEER